MTDTHSLDSLREQLAQLLAAIPGEDPTGPSLQDSPEIDRLREARREDDASLPMGVWEHALKRSNWPNVEAITSQLLATRSKDLLLAAWLGEAWLHNHRLAGLCAALELLVELGERYGTRLHPRSGDQDPSWLAPPLAWAARKYSEILNVRMPMLDVQLRDREPLTHSQWLQAQKQVRVTGDNKRAQAQAKEAEVILRGWAETVLQVPAREIALQVDLLTTCLLNLERLNRWSDLHLGEEAPSLIILQHALEQQRQAQQEFLAMHPEPAPAPVIQPAAAISEQAPAAPERAAEVAAMGPPQSREAAYQQLKVISEYLARIEPHSPVPYLIDRGIEWGNKPLRDLLGELVNADVDTRRIWSVLGVLP
ncbi:type VI secretion system protein TssA [Pseudomonas sp. LJDD11]|nr:type VI secretion system protein TssA [Pseudomonas sp. LJDD11]MCQ9422890.1 type VI secretion system protein TssA [Pseudomonas sp. LJDD11]